MNSYTFPFRLGTTSYILPDDILPNARYLADKVRDIELVLFEVDDGMNNLPSPQVIKELSELARQYEMTYTVHLPLDLKLGDGSSDRDISLIKAKRVIDCTSELGPWAYVLHLDGRSVKDSRDDQVLLQWQNQSVQALKFVANWAGGTEKLAVENLEGYPIDFLSPVLERVHVSRCVDIGHLWLDGIDPMSYLQTVLPHTRVIHLHGIADRDHRSLAFMPHEKVQAVFRELIRTNYQGVLTLEVFSQDDFLSSLDMIEKVLQ
jgi:sugar phosphate isomerase/epimerase